MVEKGRLSFYVPNDSDLLTMLDSNYVPVTMSQSPRRDTRLPMSCLLVGGVRTGSIVSQEVSSGILVKDKRPLTRRMQKIINRKLKMTQRPWRRSRLIVSIRT